jgi:predicted DNA-binding protein with PD1-like motif
MMRGRSQVLRLRPGVDLRRSLARFATRPGRPGCMVIAGIGSLDGARLRAAGDEGVLEVAGELELVHLAGTLSRSGIHLHLAVSDPQGRMTGGHLLEGCRIRTTAEILIELLDHVRLQRRRDPATGYRELVPRTLRTGNRRR